MHFSQDFSFFKKLYQSELLSIQIEGGAYDPIQNMFVNVDALRFNLRIENTIKTLKIYYECHCFECNCEYDDYNGEFATCVGEMIEPNSDHLFLWTKPMDLQHICAELVDCWSDDAEDFATYCNLFFNFDEFPIEVRFDLASRNTTVSTEKVLANVNSDNITELREIRTDGTLGR